ncbi:RNA polymerase [Acanthamoeba castellanii str. Neff]|uniref:RNA polymerase n=1 Tax=Acanthamoeba castellanii (strain ATCC 30010 / Neff) TaxID=1257118 RepID=L8HK16_ACACF|nr:RNA polymerase [Acanthamoeba castellanii str. Neff]ELR25018.1 RNA polymerase [Acanthamoeba castellanii str. Neff]
MADTAAVAKPMAAPTPDKKKKKRKSTSSTSDTPTKSASNGASSSASPSSGKISKKEKKAESSNKDVMELEEPASKPKRKFDEQTKPTGKGKEKAHKSGNDEASLATDRRKRQRLSITSEKNRPAVAPSLACFPNAPPPLASLHNKEGGIAFGMWENKGITRTKKMLVAETDKMLYLGQPVVRNPSKYYIMAVDRTTNKATMVPIANFYHMQQQIKGYTPTLPTDAEDDERSFGDQRRSLIERFGSKKKRSQVHSTLANKIVTGSVSHADDIMTSLDEKAAQKATSDGQINTEVCPPRLVRWLAVSRAAAPQRFTDTVSEIYPLGDVIPFDFLGQIDPKPLIQAAKDPAQFSATAKKTLSTVGRYGSYIAERVKGLRDLLPGELERQGRLLSLIGALLKLRSFIKDKRGAFMLGDAKDAVHGVLPEEVVRHFLPLFADGEGRRFRASTLGMTRMTTYIVILLLHASEFRLDVATLSTALELESKKCQQYLISIGCRSGFSKKAGAGASKADEEDAEAAAAAGRGLRVFTLRAPLRLPDKTRIRGKAK